MRISLNDLPEHHPFRNTKLKDLEVFYRMEGTKAWQEVFPSYNIAKNTYNELGEVWKKGQEWAVDSESTFCQICGKDLNKVTECAWTSCPKDYWDEARIDNIGQNGNEGLHYE